MGWEPSTAACGTKGWERMRRWVLLLVAVLAVGLVGCDKPRVVPIGDAPLRYRDEVFSQTETTKNIPYGSALDQFGVTQTLLLDVLTPVGDTVTARPAIVWVHGGSFKSGDKSSPQIVYEATKFAKLGYVGASINYRLYPSGCTTNYQLATCVQEMTDAQHDAQAAVRFLRANAATYGIDPTRIAIKGVSAGAITALHVGFNPEDPGTSGNPEFPSTVRAAVSISGAKKLGTADAGDASSLLLHGTDDTVVPYQWAVDTYDEATEAQLTTYLTSFDGSGHAPYSDHGTEMFEQTRNFLYWEMDLPAAAH